MINHHPKIELLVQHVNGELPASISAGIKIHCDFCQECAEKVTELTKHAASESFQMTSMETPVEQAEYDFDVDSMIEEITLMPEDDLPEQQANPSVTFRGVSYDLPDVMNKMALGKPAQIGKLSRSRILLDEGHIRSSLLRIEAGGAIPEHTHNGYEITLLLEGHFKDVMGEYGPGDFIVLDGKHQHQPMSENGCLCYTVVSDSLHFTQGINKLLNPIGSFIY